MDYCTNRTMVFQLLSRVFSKQNLVEDEIGYDYHTDYPTAHNAGYPFQGQGHTKYAVRFYPCYGSTSSLNLSKLKPNRWGSETCLNTCTCSTKPCFVYRKKPQKGRFLCLKNVHTSTSLWLRGFESH